MAAALLIKLMSELSPVTADRYCVHQVTLLEQCDFRSSVECFARHNIRQTALWRDKVEQAGVREARRILTDLGIKPVALCAALLLADDSAADTLPENRRLLEDAKSLGAESLIVITGGLPDGSRDLAAARSRATDRLGELALHAREHGINLALEPLHPMVCGFRSVISTLREANDMLDQLDMDEVLGLTVDSYALWWQADLEQQIRRSGKRIRHFHVSDWLPDTCDVRLDRGMPGDGLIDNRRIRGWLENSGFAGPVEVEIFSARNWWKRPADEVVRTIIDRFPGHL